MAKKKAKASENNAKDVEAKSIKTAELPKSVKVELASRLNNFETYLSGVIIGLGLKGEWALDPRKMQLIQKTEPKKE